MNSPRKSAAGRKSGAESQNAIELLKADHQEVDQLFEKFQSARGRSQRKKLVEQIAVALTVHATIEEEIFYPACSEHGVEEDNLEEAQVEHDTVKLLVRELVNGSLDDEYYDAKMTVLSEYVKHHVKEEEEPQEGIFARLEKTDADLEEIGQELKERKEELMDDKERVLSRPPRIRSLHIGGQSSSRPTASSRQDAERQRYPGPDDGFYGRNEEHRSSEREGRMPEREGRGQPPRGGDSYERSSRSQSGRSRSGSSAGSDDGRGWHGDPRGHAEAARRGWRQRDD